LHDGRGYDGEVSDAGALRGWRLQVAGRRLLRQGRLLLLVLAVAVLASTSVTSVGLLVAATEQSAIGTSLAALPAAEKAITVTVEQPRQSIAATTTRIDGAVRSVLGDAGTATPAIQAYSAVASLPTPGNATTLGYFGELSGVGRQVKLIAGVLPASTASPTATRLPVAVPESAAKALDLSVGSAVAYAGGSRPVTLDVVGIYRATDSASAFWSQDPLKAAGNSSGFFAASGDQLTPLDAFGPVLVSTGSMDAIGVRGDRLEFDYAPHLRTTSADDVAALAQRTALAGSQVPAQVGAIAGQVSFSGDLSVPLDQIIASLVVTRSTVAVVTLLLLVLSIAALGQAARLFTDARAGDRELMRARGASAGQVLGIASLEAGLVGLVTAAVSAPLARLVYVVIAAQPALAQARVPADSGLPGSAWLTSVGLGLLFVVVLLFSLLGRTGSFVSAEQTRSRQRRVSGLLRSGLDLGIVVLAGIAFWQLTIYRSPVDSGSTLAVDPVLAAAPALVLLAGALLAARLFPLLARLVDRLGNRSPGVLLRLASWEIGRRSARATSVVLLLTLALAVGTFSQTFLATWRQSQVDQADYAVGPPVRVPAIAAEGGAQRSLLVAGASGAPQPVIRRVADASEDNEGGEDTDAVVLGLPAGARAMLDRGQLASDGGSVIVSRLRGSSAAAHGIVLPGNPVGISAVAQLGSASAPLPGVSASVQAIVQDDSGLLTTVDLGTIPVDGTPHTVSGLLSAVPKDAQRALPLQFVGLQTDVFLSNQATYVANAPVETRLLLGQLAALTSTGGGNVATVPAPAASGVAWSTEVDGDGYSAQPTTTTQWQLAESVTIAGDVQTHPGSFSATAWPAVDEVPAVISTSLAHTLQLAPDAQIVLNFAVASVPIRIVGESALIPGTVDGSLLTASAAAGAASSTSNAVVVDQVALERALVQGGESGSTVDEWWVDVPPGSAAKYLAAHPTSAGSVVGRSSEVLARQMQQDPLRVATQAALWLAIVAAGLLAAIGFAVHSASSLAARRIELAQLRAIGLSRARLVGMIGAESLLLCALGVLFGVAVGLVLALLAGPLIALSPNGTPAVPPVRVLVPWLQLVLLVLVVVVVLLGVVAGVARGQRSSNPANILREADNG